MLEGDLDGIGAAALFRLITASRRTGCLELRRASGRGQLRFSGGYVCGADSSYADDLLGLRLEGAGVVTRRRMRAALDEQASLGHHLGELLIESGDIDQALLTRALREQMLDRILDIIEWETGTFEWTPAEEVRLDEAVAISAQEVFDERLGRRRPNEGLQVRTDDRSPREQDPPAEHSGLSLTSGESAEDIFDVVVICTGNQFRSPIVEGLMRASTSRLPLRVSSVGTKELGAAPALPEAVRIASEFGVDLTAHRARSLRGIDMSGADLVLGFELEHVAAAVVEARANYEHTFTILELISLLEQITPNEIQDPVRRARSSIQSAHRLRPKTGLLSPEAQIQDPLGGRPGVYRETAENLRKATRQLIDRLFGFVPYSPPPPVDPSHD